MITIEERVAKVEAHVVAQHTMFAAMTLALTRLEDRMDRGLDHVHRRFEQVDRRFEKLDTRLDNLDQKLSRQFTWLAGLVVTALVGMLAAVLSD